MKKSKILKALNKHPKLKKAISVLLVIIIISATIPLIINGYMVAYSSRYMLTPEEYSEMKFDCVLVLGAGLFGEYEPSPMLEERLNRGIEVYSSGCTDRILMSGDHGTEGYDEVNSMKLFAVEKGVERDNIFMDHAGFSTYESMYRARDVFEVESLVIVTQKYHLYRAIYDARKLGLEAYGVAADGQYDYGFVTTTYNNTREFLARVKDFVYCIIKPEPTYLGEVIPISSSGSMTDDANTQDLI